ncbi:MAG: hypothetical protein DRN04_12600 [Thermoprotei archaeon]|nr:MAG: hypothetical protein DRN04_12600 [Thermoprotei archaeon]
MDLKALFDKIVHCVLKSYGERVLAIIVFGSATRPRDFVWGLSDIDVLLVMNDKIDESGRSIEESVDGFKVSMVVFEKGEVEEAAVAGSPLVHWIKKDSIVLYYSSEKVLDWLNSLSPRITSYTLEVFRRSSVVAYGIAADYYFQRNGRRVVHHLYHSLRHALRYRSARELNNIPVSNEEVYAAAEKLCGREVLEVFRELVGLRRGKRVEIGVADRLLEEVSRVIGGIVELKFPRWIYVKYLLKNIGDPAIVSYGIEKNVVRVVAFLIARRKRKYIRVVI